jgi:hypothetical protein
MYFSLDGKVPKDQGKTNASTLSLKSQANHCKVVPTLQSGKSSPFADLLFFSDSLQRRPTVLPSHCTFLNV